MYCDFADPREAGVCRKGSVVLSEMRFVTFHLHWLFVVWTMAASHKHSSVEVALGRHFVDPAVRKFFPGEFSYGSWSETIFIAESFLYNKVRAVLEQSVPFWNMFANRLLPTQ